MISYKEYTTKSRRSRLFKWGVFLFAVLATGLLVELNVGKLVRGLPAMGELLSRMLRPNFAYLGNVLPALWETIEIAVLASILGTACSIPLSLLMSKHSGLPKIVTGGFSAFFALLRTIPTLVWAAFLVSMFSVGTFSGIMATFIIASLISTRLMREHIDSISLNKILSMRSTGASHLQVLRYCILPETIPNMISVFFIVLESCIRSAAVLGLVGAGGIGQTLWVELNTFRYDNIATIVLILFLTIYLMDIISVKARNFTGYTVWRVRTLRAFRLKKVAIRLLKLTGIILGLWMLFLAFQVTPERLLLGIEQGGYILRNLLQPDFTYTHKLWQGLSESFAIAVFATLLGGWISYVVVGFTAYNIASFRPISWISKAITNILRTFPPMITAIIFFRGVGPGPFAGALALTVYTAGVMVKLYSETVESLLPGILDSLRTTGATPRQVYRYGVFPESMASFFGLLLYRLESNIRNSTILGMIGAGGIGVALSANIQWRNWNRVGLLLLGSGVMIIAFDMLSRYLRKRIAS